MNLQRFVHLIEKEKNTSRLPVLFLGHGSPMNAIEHNEFVKAWQELGLKLHEVKAILCISAHWETNGTLVTAMEKPKTIHDFGGFPKELYSVNYPAPGDPVLANSIHNEFNDIDQDFSWGLDHGCWSIMKHLFPDAKIPVLQLSLDQSKNPQQHYALAKKLSVLRERGVLIIGSGNMVHNLSLLNWNQPASGFDWAVESNEIIKKCIFEGNHEKLINYQKMGKELNLAIPTPEHFLPLLYVLGMQDTTEKAAFFNDKTVMGSISMTSTVFGLNQYN